MKSLTSDVQDSSNLCSRMHGTYLYHISIDQSSALVLESATRQGCGSSLLPNGMTLLLFPPQRLAQKGASMTTRRNDSEPSPPATDLLPYIESLRKLGRRDLDALERVGVPRRPMLALLVFTALTELDRTKHAIKPMRASAAELKRLAARLETLAGDVENVIGSADTKAAFWMFALGHTLYIPPSKDVTWESEGAIGRLPDRLHAAARRFRDEAKQLARGLRGYGRKDSQGRIGYVLFTVWLFRLRNGAQVSDGPDCLEIVARLLTDAFEVVGTKRCFTTDGLRKIWKRRIASRMEECGPPPRNAVPARLLFE